MSWMYCCIFLAQKNTDIMYGSASLVCYLDADGSVRALHT